MSKDNSNRPELFVDNERYDWESDTITGIQLRELGSLPEDVEIYLKVPGQPDQPVENDTVIDLSEHKGPARFSTQNPGSQAG
jgi:Multiubiquitin